MTDADLPVEFVTLDDVLVACRRLDFDVADVGLLDAAVARPRASVFGRDAYATPAEKAAALLQSLAKNHGLVDGNKRLAFVMTNAFMRLNGHRSSQTHDELFELVMAVASSHMSVQEISEWLKIEAL